MEKIKREEYEVLKELDDKWKWIARDRDDSLYAFEKKPYKHIRTWLWRGNHDFRIITEAGFQFIQWEDEEPYNIAELIEEYEKESEETEVKNIEWLKRSISDIIDYHYEYPLINGHTQSMINEIKKVMEQADEPEVLSQELIYEKAIDTHVDTLNGDIQVTFKLDDLQNLLVPKQEDINKEKQEAYVKGFEAGEKQTVEFYEEHESEDFNKKVNQLIKAIENPKRIKLRGVIERMDVLSEKNRNDWIERINERYEVEKEQKYYVINNDHRMMLVRKMDGKTITEADPFKLEDMYEVEKISHRLTEQEIKDYDPRYWAFRKPVEELEKSDINQALDDLKNGNVNTLDSVEDLMNGLEEEE